MFHSFLDSFPTIKRTNVNKAWYEFCGVNLLFPGTKMAFFMQMPFLFGFTQPQPVLMMRRDDKYNLMMKTL